MGIFTSPLGKSHTNVTTQHGNHQADLYTFIDVETPNNKNNSICSIAVIATDTQGNLVDKRYSLVNPEAPFTDINMQVHGITPYIVRDAPTFPEVWESMQDLINASRMVAHNAKYDLRVLQKALDAYDLRQPRFSYYCTLEAAKRLLNLQSNTLPSVCQYFGIDFNNHHNALADTDACCDIFWHLMREVGDTPSFTRISSLYDTDYAYRDDETSPRKNITYSDKITALQQLKDLIGQAQEDGVIALGEANTILRVITGTPDLANDPACAPIIKALEAAVADKYLSPEESAALMDQLSVITDPVQHEGKVEIAGNSFCLTGTFLRGSRSQMEAFIKEHGGTVLKGVTKKCSYVVVGGQGSERYALGNYGTKVLKAMELAAKGVPIQIVSEEELFQE